MFSTDVAARGLDFPNLDWVVQFDAPEDPAAYIHRVGRAGRFRSKGNALTFVLPSEEAAFLDMMAEARIPVKRIAVNPSRTESVTRRVMQEVAKDAELNALAVGAFRSYVRSVALAGNKKMFDVEKLPLERGKELFGGRAVIGGFGNTKADLLYTGNEAVIKAAARSLLAKAGRTGVILGADCTVPGDIDLRHLEWVREAAAE